MSETATIKHRITSPERPGIGTKDRFLTVRETAEILSCSVNSANLLFNLPGFPGKKIPNIGWRVKESDLFGYINKIDKNG